MSVSGPLLSYYTRTQLYARGSFCVHSCLLARRSLRYWLRELSLLQPARTDALHTYAKWEAPAFAIFSDLLAQRRVLIESLIFVVVLLV